MPRSLPVALVASLALAVPALPARAFEAATAGPGGFATPLTTYSAAQSPGVEANRANALPPVAVTVGGAVGAVALTVGALAGPLPALGGALALTLPLWAVPWGHVYAGAPARGFTLGFRGLGTSLGCAGLGALAGSGIGVVLAATTPPPPSSIPMGGGWMILGGLMYGLLGGYATGLVITTVQAAQDVQRLGAGEAEALP